MKKLSTRQIVIISLIGLLLLFILQNLEVVRVKFLVFGFQLPLVILIIIVFLIGFFTGKPFNKSK
ncbi:MAG: DUF1049 domain-containing protein [Lentimicrobium sp.]|nr:DUF1049 domain-containing protein [Lentimicrobium sp.]